MSYSDFKTLEDAVNQFDLQLSISSQAFATIPPVAPSDRLRQNLEPDATGVADFAVRVRDTSTSRVCATTDSARAPIER